MGPVRNTIFEAIMLVVIGGAIASAANSLRSEHRLDWGKNYFRKMVIPKPVRTQANGHDPKNVAVEADGAGLLKDGGVKGPVTDSARTTEPAKSQKPSQADDVKTPEHPFQVASFDQVLAANNDPDKAIGLIVFVDARADGPYEEGHIPGAVQIDHYQLDRYLDDAMQYISAADKIYVYCNGGACEDSIYVCTDLYEYGIDLDRIYLYAGGWQEWSTKETAPIEKGPRRY